MIIILYTLKFPQEFVGYCGEHECEINLVLVAYAQGVGTELNAVYLQYSVISAVT